MAELGQRTVDFSTLVRRAAEDSFLLLKELVEQLKKSELSDTERKITILKYIQKTRQRMLRLDVLAKWCRQVPVVQYCQQLASTLSSHDTCFAQAADSLFFMHEGLQQACAPIYDVPSAIEVLLTGSYQRLPQCVENMGIQSSLTEDQQKPALKTLDTLLRSRLLEITLPKEISEVKVSDGTVHLIVNGEFKVILTLGYRGHLSMWRILHLKLLVGEKSGLVKLEESRRHVLGDDLERRMAAADNPFLLLYSILHELCVALIMDTVLRQVQALRQGRWRDAIRFELISDGGADQGGHAGFMPMYQDGDADSSGRKTPGLKILYWLDFKKNNGGSDSVLCPYIKIEPSLDLQVKCLHSSFVIDPLTGKEADFSLDHSCIDVEKLLLRVISCNRYTRLLEILQELRKIGQICQAADDVLLQCYEDNSDFDIRKKDNKSNPRAYGGNEVLRVRAYNSSYITLGINIRNGHFYLQSSRNVLTASSLSECEETLNQGGMTAAEVFISLRSKSILRLIASVGKFLGLQVHEQGLAAVKIPKALLNGSDVLLMEFPQCGSSYFLLIQLDNNFKALFQLLEAQQDSNGKFHTGGELNQVIRFNDIEIDRMQMLRDEINLSLFYGGNLLSSCPNVVGSNLTSEHGLLSECGLGASMKIAAGSPQSSFSSVVNELFELEKGMSAPPFPVQSNLSSSFSTPPTMNLGSVPINYQKAKFGITSPKWDDGLQQSQVNNVTKRSSGGPHSSNYPPNNLNGLIQSSSVNSLVSSPGRSPSVQKLSSSKSEQDLTSLRSTHADEAGSAMDEHQVVSSSLASRLLVDLGSPTTTARNFIKSSQAGGGSKFFGYIVSQLSKTSLYCFDWETTVVAGQAPESGFPNKSSYEVSKYDTNPRKRSISDLLSLVPSLEGTKKRRKLSETVLRQTPASEVVGSSDFIGKIDGYSYGNLLAEANKGNAPSSIYVTALLHVVRHCSVCIKYARLTSQMAALDIPYIEEAGLQIPSSNIWFRLPFVREVTWQRLCLRLGRPGSMYWDVKIDDQHFADLWELKKGSTNTPWGCGVRIATASDVDSHICYDSDGVLLTYRSVEDDSIKKLVADLSRLFNARLFSLGMRKLLGVRTDDKSEEGSANLDKTSIGSKVAKELPDKISEQLRKAFRIEAVGIMSLWFSFGQGVLARFVVEWESGKEGCTMHVSPDQLWPHTKFLEDFINGADVESLLDCIRLTAGPLHALAAASRPARAGPASGSLSAMPGISPIPKQNAFVASSVMGSLGSHNLHGAAMLAAGRGGPGIVPSSLLPIDVSIVLRGPYWIRIIYRKDFAVDMRCFAGDHVWLQPATPPKEGRTVGGSLPCPQFRPFIMEHVAQELNGLEPNFSGGQQPVGLLNSSSPNPSLDSQLAVASGSRSVNAVGIARPASLLGNQVTGLNRIGNAPMTSSIAASSGMPLRRSPGTGVPINLRGELNTAFIGLGDDGGYGGGWVPHVALKKVLRGILKYLGVLWLFAQLPDLLKEILSSILKDNEGALLNLDQEQPALRFFVGGYVFAVSVHRVQLLLQVLSTKRLHQQQQQQSQGSAQEELAQTEISEICDYFSRRVASEPYDASRVASFITLLTLPISVLREFLKLIAWKKGLSQFQVGESAPAQKPRIELCLENHSGMPQGGSSDNSLSKSNIHHDRPHKSVDFALTVVLDPANIPHVNTAGGAAWLPYCVSVRLRYSFGENPRVMFLGMEGSHGGRACWLGLEDWESCKQRVAQTVEDNGTVTGDVSQGRLRKVADCVQRTLQLCLQGMKDGSVTAASSGPV
ncbi:Mediator of rna polymerase ii transcription subunit [Thalictrum thalictroides]|uniref:Mediator of RNA polymerase II transcription subunit 14 n=1 Tax=Thalictrum thalictroides TaxID=46969 RepID=A0A7J6WJI2_THATH|nr:Mediator of rna polymerase ii transcription subunit [Thalictrum thalictroides]